MYLPMGECSALAARAVLQLYHRRYAAVELPLDHLFRPQAIQKRMKR